jgi:hypothetical protein
MVIGVGSLDIVWDLEFDDWDLAQGAAEQAFFEELKR